MLATSALYAVGAILVVWILYPAVIGILAACVRRDPPSTPYEPFVSVIVATRDDPDAVCNRVADCLAADYDPARLEIIVAVDGFSAHRAEIERALAPSLVLVVNTGRPAGKAAALNAAVASSRGAVLVFTDTFQRFSANTIRELVMPLGDPRYGAVSGMLDLPRASGASWLSWAYWRYERWLRWCEARIHSTVGVTGAVSAMRRSLWSPLPAGLLLDDVYTPMRLVLDGYRVAFKPAARAFETRAAVVGSEYRRKVRTLTGVFQLCAWLPSVMVPLRNPIWAQFLFHKLLRLLTPYCLIVMAAFIVDGAFDRSSATLALGLALLLVAGTFARRLATQAIRFMREMALMQAAIIVATAHGIRGRWNVWQQ